VRRLARQDKDVRFTALLHHVDVDRLRAAYFALRPKAALGVVGVTWHDYGQDLEDNLRDLHARVHGGGYRAKPSRRTLIPKPDGRQRLLGFAALEDKLLRRAVVEVLNAVSSRTSSVSRRGFGRGVLRITRWTRSRPLSNEAVAQTSAVGAIRQRVRSPSEIGASGGPLAPSERSPRTIRLGTFGHRWRPATDIFRCAGFVRRPPTRAGELGA
jgi:hypothetical protein